MEHLNLMHLLTPITPLVARFLGAISVNAIMIDNINFTKKSGGYEN